jgi:hypothetical protein
MERIIRKKNMKRLSNIGYEKTFAKIINTSFVERKRIKLFARYAKLKNAKKLEIVRSKK